MAFFILEIYRIVGEGNIGLQLLNIKHPLTLATNAMEMRVRLMINVVCSVGSGQMQQLANFT